MRRGVWPAWLAVFAVAACLYALTASRGPQWQDSGQHIMRILDGELVHVLGLALSHPLHYWLGRVAVRLDVVAPASAITLVSSLAAAVAVANLFGIVATLTGRTAAAVFAGASLMVAHTFWQMATVAEVYTLSAALLTAEIWCVVAYATRRHREGEAPVGSPAAERTSSNPFLVLAIAVNGLGLANHNVALLTTPVLAILLILAIRRKEIRKRQAAAAVLLWLVAASPYLGLVVVEMVRRHEFLPVLHSALFGGAYAEDMRAAGLTGDPRLHSALFGGDYADRVLNVRVSANHLLRSAGFIVLNFPNLLLCFAAYGIVRARGGGVPTTARRVLYAALALHACFVLRYPVVDQYTFFLPTYALLAVFGGVGYSRAAASGSRASLAARGVAIVLLIATPLFYLGAPAVGRRLGVLGGEERFKPYRDDYTYFLTPWSGLERSAERMTSAAIDAAGPAGLIVVPDTTSLSSVRYAVLQADAPTLSVTGEMDPEQIAEAARAGRRVVFVPSRTDTPPPPPPIGAWRREGDVYVLEYARP